EEDDKDHPYTFVNFDESLYDSILNEEEEEKRMDRRSFIMNRPPAPAPRPACLPVRNENTPYIVQVFQQKAAQVPSDCDKMYCPARKHAPCRSHAAMAAYSAVKHNIPAEQGGLICLQKQVRKAAIPADEAHGRMK
ncbi:BANK1 protein, partial [Alectura lathami]|nr:BANK1 protein [Alectura lathami]